MSGSNDDLVFRIEGMDCASCARSIEKGVLQLNGVQSCDLNFTTENLRVKGDIGRQAIIDRVRQLGFEINDSDRSRTGSFEADQQTNNFLTYMWRRPDTRLALIGLLLILPGLLFEEILNIHHPLINMASIGALVTAGLPIARSAWQSIRINHTVNINVLMTIAAVGAVVIGAYTEAGMVMVLFALGEALEGYTASRARNSIRSLMEVVPNQATRLENQGGQSQEVVVRVEDLQVGDVIIVKPGASIPMDGAVRAGISAVNQAPITGESRLIEKNLGSIVFASSINGEGVLEIEVTHLAADNTISRLIKMVEDAQDKRAPSQRFVDRFATYYTPAVVVLAALVAVVPPLLFGQPFWNPDPETFGWFYRGLALLVVACPCALVISTPVTIVSAISSAARHGVLIKGGAYLEALSRIQAVAFDKTGTLTRGKPNVVALRAAACKDQHPDPMGVCRACDEVLALASAVERRSEHPVALAIMNEAAQRGLQQKYHAAKMVKAITGKGVVGQVQGQDVIVGSHTFFDTAIPHAFQACEAANNDTRQGYTPLMVGTNGAYQGTITVADTLRESSAEAIGLLKSAGIQHVVMLTGDSQAAAETVAKQIGLTDVRADLLPENKVSAIEVLREEYGAVAMVGDGINDAPALASATVSIAIGGANGANTQAMETADITLMSLDLRRLAYVYGLSRSAMSTIKMNVVLSLAIKALFLTLVLAGLGTMWMAILADVGTSLLVTLNGMRLLGYKEKLPKV